MWRLDYQTYNAFWQAAYADSQERINQIKAGLAALPHVTKMKEPVEVEK